MPSVSRPASPCRRAPIACILLFMPDQSKPPLAGRRAFLLGGTGGIGCAVARALGLKGAFLDVHGRSPEKLESALQGFRERGIPAEGSAGPLDTLEDALPLRERAAEADILVIALGPFLRKPLHETTPEDWRRSTDFNLVLPGILASAALPRMRERGWGRVLFFGGTRTDVIRGVRTNAAYAAAKTGLGVLVKSIALQYASDGVAALALCPGFVGTEYLKPEEAEAYAARAPSGRLIDPEDIGGLAADLLAREPPVWNGAVLPLDAGLPLC